jgi:RND family efflux transporter MFP subunit
MNFSTKIFAMTALVSLGLLSGCNEEHSAASKEQSQAAKPQVIEAHVATVSLGSVPETVVVPGSVVPDQQAKIASRLMGYIKEIKVKVGQKVKAGDLLFTIDPTDIKAQIARAESAYQQALAALNDAKLDYDRFTKLYKEDSVSKQQYDKIRLQYSVAQQNVAAARSALEQAKAQLKYANVKAPFDGVVVQKLAVAGDLAAPGHPILVLENLSSLSVQTQVSNDLYAYLRLGDKALVEIEGMDKPVIGTIYTLVSAADPKTRTHTVKLSLENVRNVNSGTFARVTFNKGNRQAILIPQSAVVNRSGILGVFVLDDENHAQFRMVRTGMAVGPLVEVQAGLSLGEKIVVDNNQSLLNGDIVKPLNGSAEADKAAK